MTTATDTPIYQTIDPTETRFTIHDRDRRLAPHVRHVMYDLYLRNETITYGEFCRRVGMLADDVVNPRSAGRLLDYYAATVSLNNGEPADLYHRIVTAATGEPGGAGNSARQEFFRNTISAERRQRIG